LNHDQRRLLELFLLHHYTTVVSNTFPSADNEPSVGVLSNYIIDVAFDHPFLLNSIFALAALHLVYLERQPCSPSTSSRVDRLSDILSSKTGKPCQITPAHAHRIYFNISAKQQREALANISSKNSNALWITTIVLSLQTFAFAKNEPRNEPNTETYSLPLHWLRMTRGMMEIESALKLFTRPLSILDFITPVNPEHTDQDKDLDTIEGTPKVFDELLSWENSFGVESIQSGMNTYENAIQYIRKMYHIAKSGCYTEVFRGLLRPDPLTTSEFLKLIEFQRPRAIVILACYYALTMVVDNHWIFQGMAEYEIYGLKSLLPIELNWIMEWPLEVLKLRKVI
jgi:Fungal specific transcription factor domain